jgi:hypothetical protein
VIDAAERLRGAGIGGRFVFDVADGARRREELAAAVATARALCALDSSFRTPIRARQPEPVPAPARSLEVWAATGEAGGSDRVAESRLNRVAFYFAEAQRTPGRRLGKHVLRVLALLRVRLGFFGFDLERAAVELSALLRTGKARQPPREE